MIKTLIKYLYFKKRNISISFNNVHNVAINIIKNKNIEIIGKVLISNVALVGEYTYINDGTKIFSGKIGRFCSIGYDCIIGPLNHPVKYLMTHPIYFDEKYAHINQGARKFLQEEPPIVGDNVWIGAKSIILRGVIIGEGSIVGANTVVSKNIPPYSIAIGNPMKIIKNRRDVYNLRDINFSEKSTDEIISLIKQGVI